MSYLNRTIQLVQKIISLSKFKKEFFNIRYGLKLLLVIIDTFKGKIDPIVKQIVDFVVSELNAQSVKNTYKLALLETVNYIK
jgi:hypothetical protein